VFAGWQTRAARGNQLKDADGRSLRQGLATAGSRFPIPDRENRRVQSFTVAGAFVKQLLKGDTPFARLVTLSPDYRAISKPTVTCTRSVSSPVAIGTGAACARAIIGTGGAPPASSVIHSTRLSCTPAAFA
jgi:hypothetical protein